jgi:hypothetical protein
MKMHGDLKIHGTFSPKQYAVRVVSRDQRVFLSFSVFLAVCFLSSLLTREGEGMEPNYTTVRNPGHLWTIIHEQLFDCDENRGFGEVDNGCCWTVRILISFLIS